MAIAGLGFGVYVAVDLALVADVLPSSASTAKDLGVFNMAGALPFSVAPALAPLILTSAAAATACCTASPAPARCSRRPRSCPSGACDEPAFTTSCDHGSPPPLCAVTTTAPQPRLGASTWRVPLALVALGAIPITSGTLRMVELPVDRWSCRRGSRSTTLRPVAVHIVCSLLFVALGALQFSAGSAAQAPLAPVQRSAPRPAGLLAAFSASG